MSEIKHQNIEQVCNGQHSLLQTIVSKANEIKRLNVCWHSTVSSDLALHTRVANFRDGLLIIEVDSNVWVTLLRYAIPELKKNLACYPELSNLLDVKWYVRPSEMPAKPLCRKPPVLSEENFQLLLQTASGTGNGALRNALEKLAKDAFPIKTS